MESNKSLKELIEGIREKGEGYEKIIEKMMPLVKKYALKLFYSGYNYDDAFQEMVLCVIETTLKIQIYSSEAECLKYYKTAVIHKYLTLLLKNGRKLSEVSTEDISNEASEFCELEDMLWSIDIQCLMKMLSDKKRKILMDLYRGYSCSEIANRLHLSRQYVTRVRKEIAKYLEKNGLQK